MEFAAAAASYQLSSTGYKAVLVFGCKVQNKPNAICAVYCIVELKCINFQL